MSVYACADGHFLFGQKQNLLLLFIVPCDELFFTLAFGFKVTEIAQFAGVFVTLLAFFFFFHTGIEFLLQGALGCIEFADTFAYTFHQLRNFFATEKQQNRKEDDDHLGAEEVEKEDGIEHSLLF
mgnify:CR=1 FL=1|jgi:hypothetical protein